jgi:hypothetical protein
MSKLGDLLILAMFIVIIALVPGGIYLMYVGFTSPIWPGIAEAFIGFILVLIGIILDIILIAGSDGF